MVSKNVLNIQFFLNFADQGGRSGSGPPSSADVICESPSLEPFGLMVVLLSLI